VKREFRGQERKFDQNFAQMRKEAVDAGSSHVMARFGHRKALVRCAQGAGLRSEGRRRFVIVIRCVYTNAVRVGPNSLEPASVLILLVVHVSREEEPDGEEIIRIISARRAGKDDVRRHQKQEVD
jgi:hypothetical protein